MSTTMRTFRLVAEQNVTRYGTVLGLVAVDVVLRGERDDVDIVTSIVKAWLDVGCELSGSWVDEGTERETVTFSVAPKPGSEPECSGCRVHCHHEADRVPGEAMPRTAHDRLPGEFR